MEPDENVPSQKADALIQYHQRKGQVYSQLEHQPLPLANEHLRQYDEEIYQMHQQQLPLLPLQLLQEVLSCRLTLLQVLHQPQLLEHLPCPYAEQLRKYMDLLGTDLRYLAGCLEQLDDHNHPCLRTAESQTLQEGEVQKPQTELPTLQGHQLLGSSE